LNSVPRQKGTCMKLGMLGMWHSHAQGLVRQVGLHPQEFSLVGFFDPDPKVATGRQNAWNKLLPQVKLFDSAEALMQEKLDGVVVEGRVHENLKWAKLALESGRPVMLEKPAGDNLEEYRRIIDLARRKHLHVQMIYLFRYMSAVQEMFQHVSRGRLGAIYSFKARLPKDLASYQRFVDELKPYKGGMFFEMAGHVIDMMVALLGRPKQVTPFLAHHAKQPPENFIDNGLAVFGYERTWATIEVPALEVAPFARRVEVYGTEGALVIPHLGSGHLANKNTQSVEVFRKGEADWQKLALPAATLQLRDLREFAAVVAGKKDPDFSLDHDLIVQETLLRASSMS
jgi:predicted dehydrogenase